MSCHAIAPCRVRTATPEAATRRMPLILIGPFRLQEGGHDMEVKGFRRLADTFRAVVADDRGRRLRAGGPGRLGDLAVGSHSRSAPPGRRRRTRRGAGPHGLPAGAQPVHERGPAPQGFGGPAHCATTTPSRLPACSSSTTRSRTSGGSRIASRTRRPHCSASPPGAPAPSEGGLQARTESGRTEPGDRARGLGGPVDAEAGHTRHHPARRSRHILQVRDRNAGRGARGTGTSSAPPIAGGASSHQSTGAAGLQWLEQEGSNHRAAFGHNQSGQWSVASGKWSDP